MTDQLPRRRMVFSATTRSIEWLMSWMMMAWAITLAYPGSTLAISSYQAFKGLGLTETNLASFYGILGSGRMVLLAANGAFARGAEVRFICSAVGAFTWLVTSLLFFTPVFVGHAPLPVIATYHVIFFVAEVYSIGVAALDRRTGQ